MTLTAYCEQCDEVSEVYADELFEFDCRCDRCDAMLVLQEEDPDAPEPQRTGSYDLPTRTDQEPAGLPELDPNDPYAMAAHALDASVTGRLGPPVSRETLEMPVPDLPPDELRTTGALARDGDYELPTAAPLPSWDGGDTQQVDALAKQELLAGQQLPPLQNLDDPDGLEAPTQFADDIDAALAGETSGEDDLEVLHLDGETAGRGSRTYDQPLEVDTLDGALGVVEDRPPAPATDVLLASDLDWLALINDALPEDGGDDDPDAPGKARVYIRVPEEMAPTDSANPEQIKRFQETMSQLEQGGSLESMLNPARGAQRFDPEQTGKLRVGTTENTTASWEQRLEVQAVEPGVPTPLGKAQTKDIPIPDIDGEEPHQGPTQAWEQGAPATAPMTRGELPVAPAPAPEPPPKPPSRAHVRRPTPRSVIEQFQRSDLDVGLVCARDVGSPEADHFRRLYQRIFQSNNGSSPRVVMVTSPGPAEGKTTVAANLAIVGARIPGGGALLVDADPRGRGVLKAFGQRAQMDGLLEALQTQRELSHYVVGFNLGTLDVVPLGLPSSDAVELLASHRMADFVDTLRQSYASSVVIIDCCSLLHAALAPLVDGVIVVARAGHTKRDDLTRTLEEIDPRRVLGVVLNDAAE